MGKKEKQVLLALAAAALIMLGVFALMENVGDRRTAQVWIDGEMILEMDLLKEEDHTIDLFQYGVQVQLEVKDHKIGFLSSDCPDHLCMGFGFIDHEPQTAVCMPNKVVVTVLNS